MFPPRNYRIVVSQHARERARERFPGYKAARITDEVRLALAAGRVSTQRPVGVWRTDGSDNCLFAWTAGSERVFVLTLNAFDAEASFMVKTVIRPSTMKGERT